MAVDFTIAICTHNRAAELPRSIAAACRQAAPGAAVEVLVVDNASSDATRDVIATCRRTWPALRAVTEPRRGLSHARNRALREAAGEVIVYVDDDGELCADYIAVLRALWLAERPAAAGGPIRVRYLDAAPPWWKPGYDAFCGRVDYGDAPRALHFPAYPYGSNLALDRRLAIALGGFDPRLGVGPRGPWAAEETELCARLEAHGHSVFYHPGLVVTHYVRLAARTPAGLRKLAFYRGRSYFHTADTFYARLTWKTFLRQFVEQTAGAFPWGDLLAQARVASAAGALYEATRAWATGAWRPRRSRPAPPTLPFPD